MLPPEKLPARLVSLRTIIFPGAARSAGGLSPERAHPGADEPDPRGKDEQRVPQERPRRVAVKPSQDRTQLRPEEHEERRAEQERR